MEVQIKADIYSYYEYQCPIYRVWIDDTLYVEREFWIDCLSNYIQEEIYMDLEPGPHRLIIEKVTVPQAKIWAEKLVIRYANNLETLNLGVNPEDKQTIEFLINTV